MIDKNILNLSYQIKQAVARVVRPLSLNVAQNLELAIAFTFLRRIDCLIGQYAGDCSLFYFENKDKLSDKLLDEKLKEFSGGYNFYNVSGYTFEGFLKSGLSVEVALNSYLQGFCSDVRFILSDMNFEHNTGVLLRKSEHLVELFEFFSELDLSESAFSNKRFIDLITTLISDGFRHNGFYPTPIGLSKLICECLFCKEVCEGLIYSDPLDEISVYDPVCGTGSLLAYAGEKAKAEFTQDVYLMGKEISTFPCAIANALILLTGNANSFAKDVNTITDEDSHKSEYKFIVGDLPLGLPWTPFKERVMRENLKENGRFSKGLPGTGDSQFLFIQDIFSKMDSLGGRAAFVTSAYTLYGGSVKSGESRIRRWLFESGLVETIIALPSGILSPYTNIPVFLWILSCNIDPYCNEFCEKMDGKVRLIDATKLYSSRNKFKIDDAFIEDVLREYKSLENTSATQIVNKEDFGFYEVKLIEDGKKTQIVRISLDTDIKVFVEKERKPYSKGEIAIDYSSVEKGYSVDFSKFFKSENTTDASIEDESIRMLSVIDTINSLKKDIEDVVHNSTDNSVSDEWKELPLHAATEIIQANIKPNIADMRGLPIISLAYLRGNKVDEELFAFTHNSKRISSSDVIFVRTGANAGEVFRGVDGILSPTLAAIRCTDESRILPNYLYYLLKGYEKTLRAITSGTSIKTLNTKSIMDFKCLIPSVEEQAKIAAFLDEIILKIDNITKNIVSSNSIFSQYRQTLIENAVRGKIRLI